jgi:hypothetical protein
VKPWIAQARQSLRRPKERSKGTLEEMNCGSPQIALLQLP